MTAASRKKTMSHELSDLLKEKEEQIAGLMEEGVCTCSSVINSAVKLCPVNMCLLSWQRMACRRGAVQTAAPEQQHHQETEGQGQAERPTNGLSKVWCGTYVRSVQYVHT